MNVKRKFFPLFLAGVAAVVAFGIFIFGPNQQVLAPTITPPPVPAAATRTYTNTRFGFSFDYPTHYFLEQTDLSTGERGHIQVVLTENTEENRAVREGRAPGREGPTAITLDIYQNNIDRLSLMDWLRGTNQSNYKLSPDGKFATTTIAGEDAVTFRWSGLYEADAAAFIHGDSIFSFAATWMDARDVIREDFREVLRTFRFN